MRRDVGRLDGQRTGEEIAYCITRLKVLWVSAHPDPRSLNGAIRDDGLAVLRGSGHEVVESDLYAMGWNPVVDHADFAHDRDERLDVLTESERALNSGTLAGDSAASRTSCAGPTP